MDPKDKRRKIDQQGSRQVMILDKSRSNGEFNRKSASNGSYLIPGSMENHLRKFESEFASLNGQDLIIQHHMTTTVKQITKSLEECLKIVSTTTEGHDKEITLRDTEIDSLQDCCDILLMSREIDRYANSIKFE